MSDQGPIHPSTNPAASSDPAAHLDFDARLDPGARLDHDSGFDPSLVQQPLDRFADERYDLTEFDEEESEQPRRPSNVRRIVLISLLSVVVLVAAVLGYFGWQIGTQKDVTLTTPTSIGEFTLNDSPDGKSTADYLQTALAAEVNLDNVKGAVYSDAAHQNVLFLGGTGLIWSPDKDLNSAFGLISDKQGAVTDLHGVSAGKLGGTMKCGTTKSDNGNLSVCGWADHGSVAVAMFPNRSATDSAELLLQFRDAVEKRN